MHLLLGLGRDGDANLCYVFKLGSLLRCTLVLKVKKSLGLAITG